MALQCLRMRSPSDSSTISVIYDNVVSQIQSRSYIDKHQIPSPRFEHLMGRYATWLSQMQPQSTCNIAT